jgi:hypothetical protein
LSRAWLEVLPVESVRQQAEELLTRRLFKSPTGFNRRLPSSGARDARNGGYLFV